MPPTHWKRMNCCRKNRMRRSRQGPTWQEATAQQQAFAWRFLEKWSRPAPDGDSARSQGSRTRTFMLLRAEARRKTSSARYSSSMAHGWSFSRQIGLRGKAKHTCLSYILQKDCTVVNLLLV